MGKIFITARSKIHFKLLKDLKAEFLSSPTCLRHSSWRYKSNEKLQLITTTTPTKTIWLMSKNVQQTNVLPSDFFHMCLCPKILASSFLPSMAVFLFYNFRHRIHQLNECVSSLFIPLPVFHVLLRGRGELLLTFSGQQSQQIQAFLLLLVSNGYDKTRE